MNVPVLTFRGATTPYSALTSQVFVKTTSGGTQLPVGQGEVSDNFLFRIYNNWALASSIATALNCKITTYDGAGAGSHTALTPPVSQAWIHMLLHGIGEGATTPGTFTSYVGTDTAIGGSSFYVPEKGSDAVTGEARIRAGTDTNGVGFLECTSYASVPISATPSTYSFVITIQYEYTL